MIIDEGNDLVREANALREKEAFTVVSASSSREALELLNMDNEERFDLILVNTRMPGCLQTLALFCIKPPLKKQLGEREQFLQKPFTIEELFSFVKQNIANE